jgi:RNA polymerase sigma-70 factor (ECF subfamily)
VIIKMDKAQIIKQCKLGDIEGFSELYNMYSKQALGTAYLIAGHSGLAEDIVHEAFIHCFISIHKLKSMETFEVWFYKIVTRTGWKLMAQNKDSIGMDEIENKTPIVDLQASVELETCVDRLTIYEALTELSIEMRTVIVLHYFSDLSIKDISKILGCFEGTVKSRLHNAKKQLKEILQKDHIVDELRTSYALKE